MRRMVKQHKTFKIGIRIWQDLWRRVKLIQDVLFWNIGKFYLSVFLIKLSLCVWLMNIWCGRIEPIRFICLFSLLNGALTNSLERKKNSLSEHRNESGASIYIILSIRVSKIESQKVTYEGANKAIILSHNILPMAPSVKYKWSKGGGGLHSQKYVRANYLREQKVDLEAVID